MHFVVEVIRPCSDVNCQCSHVVEHVMDHNKLIHKRMHIYTPSCLKTCTHTHYHIHVLAVCMCSIFVLTQTCTWEHLSAGTWILQCNVRFVIRLEKHQNWSNILSRWRFPTTLFISLLKFYKCNCNTILSCTIIWWSTCVHMSKLVRFTCIRYWESVWKIVNKVCLLSNI